MNITRFDPWYLNVNRRPASEWRPAVDIIDEKDRFLIRADVPGVGPGDIDITMERDVLTISGVRHSDEQTSGEGHKRIERITGQFTRRFSLPETVDADGILARNSNGVLEVSIPKQPEIQPRRITVEAA